MVEWSEQLRSVTSVWLGAAAVGFESVQCELHAKQRVVSAALCVPDDLGI